MCCQNLTQGCNNSKRGFAPVRFDSSGLVLTYWKKPRLEDVLFGWGWCWWGFAGQQGTCFDFEQ